MADAGALVPVDSKDAAKFGWIEAPHLRKIVAALEARAPGCARFVGGCVRDSLRGEPPKDVDIATTLLPDAVTEALAAAGLRSAPTGLEHGTVTAIAEGVGVEVTTLRADVSTDGRRATVAFTTDWALDALRRDFRLNAVYLTPALELFDPVGGAEDAREGRVRFIGSAAERIREDYLRILRFFRFSARFDAAFDAEGLGACAALKDGLACLSAERMGEEFGRILQLPRAALAVDAMAATGILEKIWPAPPDRRALARLKEIAPDADAPLGLAALFGEGGEGVDSALRLSNAEAHRRKRAVEGARELASNMPEKAARALLYRWGPERWRDAVCVAAAASGAPWREWDSLFSLPDRWPAPVFPYSGKDVIAAGVAKGPLVATTLKAVEERWIAEDFPGPQRLAQILRERVAAAARPAQD